MDRFQFGPATADERIAFGAERPGHNSKAADRAAVDEWIAWMDQHGVRRVVCLLAEEELASYAGLQEGLLGAYRAVFGAGNVAHQPVRDLHLCDEDRLHEILAALRAADTAGERVVVHCSGGMGRTGQVLAAWLVHARGLEPEAAIKAVSEAGRKPGEAIEARNASEADLLRLLDGCRPTA